MKQSPGYHSSAGADVVGSRLLVGELPARSPDPGTGRAGASSSCSPDADVILSYRLVGGLPARGLALRDDRAGASPADRPCFPSGDMVSSPGFGRGVAGADLSADDRAGASPQSDASCLPADDVLVSAHLGGPVPVRSLGLEARRAGVAPPSPAGPAREMTDEAWHRVEAFTALAPEKPAFGSPCNGCGFCCAAEPCGVARQFVPGAIEGAPCPAMEFEHGRFWCGMVRRPGHYLGLPAWGDEEMGAMIGEALGAGKGCCADVG